MIRDNMISSSLGDGERLKERGQGGGRRSSSKAGEASSPSPPRPFLPSATEDRRDSRDGKWAHDEDFQTKFPYSSEDYRPRRPLCLDIPSHEHKLEEDAEDYRNVVAEGRL